VFDNAINYHRIAPYPCPPPQEKATYKHPASVPDNNAFKTRRTG